MSGNKWSRRDLLKWGIGTGVTTAFLESVGNMVHVPGWNSLLTGSLQPFPDWWVKDSHQLTRYLGRHGAAAQLATFFQLQQAQALPDAVPNDWSLVTIKIFDQVHTPLVFALGKLTADGKDTMFAGTSPDNHPATNKAVGSRAFLEKNGIKNLASQPRLAGLRFNKWFGDMLHHGTADGKPKSSTSKNACGYDSFVDLFPDNVAIQTGIGLFRFKDFAVHNLTLTKIRPSLCDLSHMAGYKGLVQSPLGITAFMMGDQYDANGGVENNVVFNGLSSAQLTNFAVSGRSVKSIVDNIDQSLSGGYGDYRSFDGKTVSDTDPNSKGKNLSNLFDRISVQNPKRRTAILDSREKLRAVITELKTLGSNEDKEIDYKNMFADELSANPNDMAKFREAIGNSQAIFNKTEKKASEQQSKQEFLAQCAFVSKSLAIQGQPYRNFSLFLNVNDLDGSAIDQPVNGIASSYNALNYVEGMRQLAIGLNMLAKASSGKNVLIMVVSDGGRSREMGDGVGSSFCMLLGPKKEGGLDDALHGPMKIIEADKFDDKAHPIHILGEIDPNTKDERYINALAWDTGGTDWGLRSNSGIAEKANAYVGDWQVGVLQFLAEAQGRNIMAPEFERYVRFKRFTKT